MRHLLINLRHKNFLAAARLGGSATTLPPKCAAILRQRSLRSLRPYRPKGVRICSQQKQGLASLAKGVRICSQQQQGQDGHPWPWLATLATWLNKRPAVHGHPPSLPAGAKKDLAYARTKETTGTRTSHMLAQKQQKQSKGVRHIAHKRKRSSFLDDLEERDHLLYIEFDEDPEPHDLLSSSSEDHVLKEGERSHT